MAAAAKTKPDIRFAISTTRDNFGNGYVCVDLGCVLVRDGQVLNPGYDYTETDALSDLSITGQCDMSDQDRWYGWQVRFVRPYDIDLPKARSMAKVLESVARKLAKAELDAGRPESFPAFALRVARAVGSVADNPFGVRDSERSFDGTGYRWLGADGLAHYLQDFAVGKIPATSER